MPYYTIVTVTRSNVQSVQLSNVCSIRLQLYRGYVSWHMAGRGVSLSPLLPTYIVYNIPKYNYYLAILYLLLLQMFAQPKLLSRPLFPGSNLILKASLDDYGPGNPINFASWMQYAVIPMLINFILCWLWLQVWYLGKYYLELF